MSDHEEVKTDGEFRRHHLDKANNQACPKSGITFPWNTHSNYLLIPRIAVAFSMNLSAEAMTAFAPDWENSAEGDNLLALETLFKLLIHWQPFPIVPCHVPLLP
jgi:hypothetical protein